MSKEHIDEISKEERKALLEAILFIENEPIEMPKLVSNTGFKKNELLELLKELQEEYAIRNSGIQIIEIADGYQMLAHPRFSLVLSKIYGVKNKSKLSRTSLETLAIIAYKQPVTKSEIESVRGVACERVVKQLLEKDMVKIVGRREGPGKPLEFGTTKNFLKIFGLKTINELPRLREIKEMEFGVDESEEEETDQ